MNEREYALFMEATFDASWSDENRTTGRNRFSDELADDGECGCGSEKDWTQDPQ